jgi:glycerol-3-phosphate dehydrogenase
MPGHDSPSDRSGPRFDRADALARMADEHFDVLVVGGGITGAGVALDAASRGLRTALVEKGDFASGTSSKSSKLVHGGLRYLQQHEYRLVYENLAERQRLLENAPHLVSALPFLIPLFGKEGVVNAGVARVYRLALWLYDLSGGVRIGRRHQNVSKGEALAHMPHLRADRLVAGFLYWDARADDARLTLAVMRTAVLDHGAVAVNHATVTALTVGAGGKVEGARIAPEGVDPFEIRASVVVNAAGIWSDQVRALDEHRDPHSIRPAKGIHITVPQSAFPCDIASVIPVPEDHRSIFAVSWDDQVYLGTTDTPWDGPLDDPTCLPEDVDYILAAANAISTVPIGRTDITGVWAGLRPLLAPGPGRRKLSERTADLSRRHTVQTSEHGVVSVTGGKLTTYRKMAEDTVDAVLKELGRKKKSARCVTRNLRLRGAGGQARPARPAASTVGARSAGTDDPAAIAAHLAGRFGSETPDVLALIGEQPGLLDPLVDGLRYVRAEALYAVRSEMAGSVADVLDRRTRASLRDARAAARASLDVATLIGPELGWDRDQIAREAAGYEQSLLAQLARAGLGDDDPVHSDVTASRGRGSGSG